MSLVYVGKGALQEIGDIAVIKTTSKNRKNHWQNLSQ